MIKNSQEAYWESKYFPLPVYVDKNMPNHIIVGIYEATDVWNTRTGVNVFTPILVDFMEELPSGCGWLAAVQQTYDNDKDGYWRGIEKPGSSSICLGEVSIRHGTVHAYAAKLWIHELGHALGLAHDHGDRRSIMYPTVYSDFPQYVMPDDASSVRTMVLGTFVPMNADLKMALYRFLEQL
jgi:hypothetical protein